MAAVGLIFHIVWERIRSPIIGGNRTNQKCTNETYKLAYVNTIIPTTTAIPVIVDRIIEINSVRLIVNGNLRLDFRAFRRAFLFSVFRNKRLMGRRVFTDTGVSVEQHDETL